MGVEVVVVTVFLGSTVYPFALFVGSRFPYNQPKDLGTLILLLWFLVYQVSQLSLRRFLS